MLSIPELRPQARWLPLARAARVMRNQTAHYRPVTYRDFLDLTREIASVSAGR